MPHETALIGTIAAAFGLAFVLGLAAARLRLPPLVGYLLAGVIIGPFTPGYVADTGLASQLAEIGVILLMFGVGMHFSVGDLLAVRRIAIPGAVAQITLATVLGMIVSHWWGWSWSAGMVFGLALSVASTVVLLRALEERGVLDSTDGRIAVGWLIVEDLVTVLALVLLPALAGTPPSPGDGADAAAAPRGIGVAILVTLLKVGGFLALMYFVGRRFVPWLLARVAREGSRELFTLAVLATSIGLAVGAALLFGVSFALGAFFAGVVISESDLSHQAAADALPLQDAFAVLFFVSVGMLFDPAVLLRQPLQVLAVLAIVLVGKSIAAFGIVLLFRHPLQTALTISASLAQIGEFSFILAGLGITLGLLPEEARSLVLAGALLSITVNPLVFGAVPHMARWFRSHPRLTALLEREVEEPVLATSDLRGDALHDHVILVGYGRVGRTVAAALSATGVPVVIVERDRVTVEDLRAAGMQAVFGDAARPGILSAAHPEQARLVVTTAPDAYHAERIIQLARAANPAIETAVRTHSEGAHLHMLRLGVGRSVMGEQELALGLAHFAMQRMGCSDDQADAVVARLREVPVAAGAVPPPVTYEFTAMD